MPRAPGQIDEAKSEALLDAAAELFAEKGLSASMDAIARRAGVSKQTLYNRFPSKVEIARALATRRSAVITAPLRGEGDARSVLTAFAESLLLKLCQAQEGAAGSLRGVVLMSPDAPDIAHAVYDAGPAESLRQLSAWLAAQDRQGALAVPDPDMAAEMYAGMVLGHGHLRMMLAIPTPWTDLKGRAREAADRFVRAFGG